MVPECLPSSRYSLACQLKGHVDDNERFHDPHRSYLEFIELVLGLVLGFRAGARQQRQPHTAPHGRVTSVLNIVYQYSMTGNVILSYSRLLGVSRVLPLLFHVWVRTQLTTTTNPR